MEFRKTMRSRLAGLAVLALLVAPAMAKAETTADTIKAKGKLVVGIQADNRPWGYTNTKGETEGFDADIANLFGKELGVPVEFTPLANAARIPALQTGRVDILFSTLAMIPERAKAVQFSMPYAANELMIVGPKATKITGYGDLNGMKVGLPKGTAQEPDLVKNSPKAELLRFDDDATTIQSLISGQVQAISAGQFYLPVMESRAPGVYEKKFTQFLIYNGAGTRLGEKEWNKTVNAFIEKAKSNGDLEKLYQKWMKMPVPEFPPSIEGIPYTVQ